MVDVTTVRKGGGGYLDDVEDLARGLFHLTHLVHKVPELRSSGHLVGREHLHPVYRRVGFLIGGCLAAHHLVLAHGNHLYNQSKQQADHASKIRAGLKIRDVMCK